jgi:Insertion element 4 transposase N-terminal
MVRAEAGGVPGRLTDAISLGVLASSVPRDAVDAAIAAHGRQARRRDGKLPPHVMVYFVLAMALFAAEDYEEVAARLAGTLTGWGCWDDAWTVPTSGGITQARQRLGAEPLAELFGQVARPVADLLTRGAFCGPWRLMAIDGFEWDAPDSAANVAGFGYGGSAGHRTPFPKVRVVTVSECGSHAVVDAEMGGTKVSEQVMARKLYQRFEPGWLVLADRNFHSFTGWQAAARTGAELLWRVSSRRALPVIQTLPDGSYRSLMLAPAVRNSAARARLVAAARAGQELSPDRAIAVRVIEYQVPDRTDAAAGAGDTIRLVTTIADPAAAPASVLAQAYHQRWEHELGNDQIKTLLRGPGQVLRSHSPDMARQEIYGYLLAHHAISALICQAATEADIDPDRIKFLRTVRIARRALADPAVFFP